MLNFRTRKIIELNDWNNLVETTYGRQYNFQQQNGCKDRGYFNFTIPTDATDDDYMNDSIPEEVNGEIMGVKFATWLARDPKQPIINQESKYDLELFWERNFYPDIYTIANDMYNKGLIEKGEYSINIDW